MNADSHDLLSDEWEEAPNDVVRLEYGGYQGFQGHRYPTTLTRLANGGKAVNATVADLNAEPLDEALLIPPKGAIERRQCPDFQHTVALSTPDPIYPQSARENGIGGQTTIVVTVLSDGSIDNVQLVEGPGIP